METKAAIEWLNEGARYFEKLDTGGEDRTFWSNVYNAENARKIRDRLVAAERIYLALKPFGNPPKTSYGARIINECC